MKTPNIFFQNRLPHILPIGACFFVTFRLGDSLPIQVQKDIILKYQQELESLEKEAPTNWKEQKVKLKRAIFEEYEQNLDQNPFGACYLKNPQIAQIVVDQIFNFDKEWYKVHAFCIMPNHVHLLLDLSVQVKKSEEAIGKEYVQLHRILKRIKGASARYANLTLGRSGTFWQRESYDHFIRDAAEWQNTVAYILNNPVKAGLVKHWEDWPYSYYRF